MSGKRRVSQQILLLFHSNKKDLAEAHTDLYLKVLLVHAPLAALTILTMLGEAKGSSKKDSVESTKSTELSTLALSTVTDLVELIPERAFQERQSTSQSEADEPSLLQDLTNTEIIQKIKSFYVHDQGNLDACPSPFSSWEISELLIREVGSITCQSLCEPVSSADVGIKSKLLVVMLGKVPRASSLNVGKVLSSMLSSLNSPSQLPFYMYATVTSLAASLYSSSCITATDLSGLVSPLVRIAWSYLSASHPKYHVETVRCLWQLQSALSLENREIEASLCSLMAEHDLTGTYAIRDADPGRSFSILWTHTLQDNAGHADRRTSKVSKAVTKDVRGPARLSGIGNYEVMLARPLFIFLDALLDERTQLFMTARTWLQSLVGVDK